MAVHFKNYYETLGVARTASAEEIKAAFRKLARLYHPDVAKDKASAEAKFKEINEANEVLSDLEKRRRYDELGANWDQPAAGDQPAAAPTDEMGGFEFGGTGFSDFFEAFFSQGSQHFGSRRGRPGGRNYEETAAFRGDDLDADLLVTLEEALHGSVRRITLRRPGFNGEEGRTQSYQVRIPQGVHEGQRIRLAGQGWPGAGGGAAGDLFLHVRFARHPEFSVEGSDLTFDLALAPWEAVLGTKVAVPSLDGTVSLQVPAHTAAGDRLRLRGLGLPQPGGGRGDLYARAQIVVPETSSPAETALWQQLAQASKFQPRKTP